MTFDRSRPVALSITHNLAVQLEPEKDVGESGEATPDDHVPGWRVAHPVGHRRGGGVMLNLLPGGRILVAVEAVDGRKGIDSLAGVVRTALKGDPLSGDLFVFKTRRADKLKILAWMGDGFALYLRRLEKGTFAFPTASDASVTVTPTQLAMILGGLDPTKARERQRYKTPA